MWRLVGLHRQLLQGGVIVHWTQLFLAVVLIGYLAVFAAIMVMVRRRTGGSAAGHAGGHHSAALVNGVATLLLIIASVAYVLDTDSPNWFGRIAFLKGPIPQGLGIVACLLSGICIVWGEISLGTSFRVALPESKQRLVTEGIYRFTRNPLALSVDLLALGVLLLAPSWLTLVSLIANMVGYEWKIRIEEAYLREAHGASYDAYCRRTGRYLSCLAASVRADES